MFLCGESATIKACGDRGVDGRRSAALLLVIFPSVVPCASRSPGGPLREARAEPGAAQQLMAFNLASVRMAAGGGPS